jgi:hypothetical protein
VRRAGRLACGRCGPARTATGPSRPASPGYPAGPRPAPDGSGCRRIGPRTSRSRRPRTQPGCGPARCAGSARPPAQRAAASRPARSPPAAGGRSPPPAAPRRRRSAGRCCRPGSGGARGRAPGPRRAPLPRGARPRLDSRPRGRSGYAIRGWGVAAVEGVDRGGVHHRLTAPHRLFDRGRVGDIAHHGVQVGSLQTEWEPTKPVPPVTKTRIQPPLVHRSMRRRAAARKPHRSRLTGPSFGQRRTVRSPPRHRRWRST